MEPHLTTRIVGIVLVQNEEHFITWAIGNALEFCDEWLVIDNRSRDATPGKLAALAAAHPGKIRLIEEPNALRTNAYVQPYIGQDVWVFGLDGDEIYDREGLRRMRQRVLAGEFARNWRLFGHSLHATRVDLANGTAAGYTTPEAKPAIKLYNFAVMESWHANTQRLHGTPVLKPGFSHDEDRSLAREADWDHCDLRDLHLCFFPRSSINVEVEMRANITDRSFRNVWRRPLFKALQAVGLGRGRMGAYLARRAGLKKPLQYVRGEIVERRLEGFGSPSDYAALDGQAGEVERLLVEISARRGAEPQVAP
jgi:hypothetical protein